MRFLKRRSRILPGEIIDARNTSTSIAIVVVITKRQHPIPEFLVYLLLPDW